MNVIPRAEAVATFSSHKSKLIEDKIRFVPSPGYEVCLVWCPLRCEVIAKCEALPACDVSVHWRCLLLSQDQGLRYREIHNCDFSDHLLTEVCCVRAADFGVVFQNKENNGQG